TREDTPGNRVLASYVVLKDDSADGTEVRDHLRQRLPEYMVPSIIVSLDSLPATANGKIDRRALPAPVLAGMSANATATEAPRTHVEQQLTEIWEDLFGLQKISIIDNFFDLGGYSIIAVKLMGQIARSFGKRLALNTLFESPTIEQLAKRIE